MKLYVCAFCDKGFKEKNDMKNVLNSETVFDRLPELYSRFKRDHKKVSAQVFFVFPCKRQSDFCHIS